MGNASGTGVLRFVRSAVGVAELLLFSVSVSTLLLDSGTRIGGDIGGESGGDG